MTDLAPAPATAHPKREDLVALARRTLAHAQAGTTALAESVVEVPASNYVDEDRWQLEIDRVFKRVPLVAGFSCEFTEPGAYRAFDLGDVPVLLMRDSSNVLRSFVNACSHRGAQLVEGAGTSRRLSCPYHAWVYNNDGALVGIRDHSNFGDIDFDCNGLTELGCDERAGIVWVSLARLNGEEDLDIDTWLCGYDEYLDALGIGDASFVARQSVGGPNWKLAYDGYLDLYHLPILHKDSFGPDFANKAIYDAWGPHQRVSSPDERVLELEHIPEDDWSLLKLTTGIWTIFPHVSIARFGAGVPLFMISQLLPGETPGTSMTTQHFLAVSDPSEHMETIEEQMTFLLHVVRDEDYFTGIRIGQSLATGAKDKVLFGRNEAGGQRFHEWVDQLVGAETNAQVAALLHASEPIAQQ
jgi:nitrite reductase/ring-hydroxylating ferredoxin subunit